MELMVELHPEGCVCHGGSWVVAPGGGSACPHPEGMVLVTFDQWRAMGKPRSAEAYKVVLARIETAGGDRREFPRFQVALEVRLTRIGTGRVPTQAEQTVTETLGQGGAEVRSRMAVEDGEVLVFELLGGSFSSRAKVESLRVGSDLIQRCGLRFLDALLPEYLIPAGAQELPKR